MKPNIKAIKERLGKITKGPWEQEKRGKGQYTVAIWAKCDGEQFDMLDSPNEADSTFIAAAPTDIADLIKHVEGQEARLKVWETQDVHEAMDCHKSNVEFEKLESRISKLRHALAWYSGLESLTKISKYLNNDKIGGLAREVLKKDSE